MSSASLLSHSATPATMGHHSKFKEPLVLFLHSRENPQSAGVLCLLPSLPSPQTLPSISPLSLGTASGAQRRVLLVEWARRGYGALSFPTGGAGSWGQWAEALTFLISEYLEDTEPFTLPRVNPASTSPECHYPERVCALSLP